MKASIIFLFLLVSHELIAQVDSTGKLSIGGYVDVYYGWDFGNPQSHLRPGYLVNHNRHNEVNLNLGLLKLNYLEKSVRANVGFMTGTYAQYNLAHEPVVLRHLFEANVGIRLSERQNLWLDAGVFPSHIGFESVSQFENWTLSRSILAENSPYYESGVKLTYVSNGKKLLLSLLGLNGWQRITRSFGQQAPAFGHQVLYRATENLFLNSSGFIGREENFGRRFNRYFHNLYGVYERGAFGLIAGFDFGLSASANTADYWYATSIIGRYRLSNKFGLAARFEFYEDVNNVLIDERSYPDFSIRGLSLNSDYSISKNVLWRLEWRNLAGRWRGQNHAIYSSLALKF